MAASGASSTAKVAQVVYDSTCTDTDGPMAVGADYRNAPQSNAPFYATPSEGYYSELNVESQLTRREVSSGADYAVLDSVSRTSSAEVGRFNSGSTEGDYDDLTKADYQIPPDPAKRSSQGSVELDEGNYIAPPPTAQADRRDPAKRTSQASTELDGGSYVSPPPAAAVKQNGHTHGKPVAGTMASGYAIFQPPSVNPTPDKFVRAATLVDQSIALRKGGQVAEAERALREAIKADHNSVPAWTNLGNLLCDEKKDIPGAVEAYETALRIDPSRSTVWFNLGHLHEHQENDFEAARRAYVKATEADPEYARAWCNLGLLHLRTGDTAPAEKAFRQAVQRDPLNATAWYKLGGILNDRMKFKEGKKAWRKCLEADPDYVRADKIKAFLDT